jgi:hypothetical protein
MIDVSVSYVNPSPLDNCEQYTAKAMFGLRQAYGVDNVVVVNGTAGRLVGPITIPVLVTDTRTNRTGETSQPCRLTCWRFPGSCRAAMFTVFCACTVCCIGM